MKLIDAYNLLVNDGIADNHRYFSEVYKLYGFADDRTLKDYLDFIDHETVAWMQGFPAKLTTKLAFSKPKTAIIKLLKKQSVIQALGADYITRIHDKVWNTFKKEADRLVADRNKHTIIVEKEDRGDLLSMSSYSHSSAQPKEDDGRSVGTVETVETLPTPPLPRVPRRMYAHPHQNLTASELPNTQDRVDFLKEVIMKMADALPAGYADAFRLLVSRVP